MWIIKRQLARRAYIYRRRDYLRHSSRLGCRISFSSRSKERSPWRGGLIMGHKGYLARSASQSLLMDSISIAIGIWLVKSKS